VVEPLIEESLPFHVIIRERIARRARSARNTLLGSPSGQ
jgi:hypothetical protein